MAESPIDVEATLDALRNPAIIRPDMQEIIIATIGAVGLALAAIVGVPRIVRDARWRIQRDLEIYKLLPKESSSRASLFARIDSEVEALDLRDQERRHPFGIGLGIAFVLIGGALLWLIILWGHWWWIASPLAVASLIIGLAGFASSTKKGLRDDKGTLLPKQVLHD